MIDIARISAFDVETKGHQPLFGLQPCRAMTGDAWLTTCAFARWAEHEHDGSPSDIETEAWTRPSPEQLSAWLDTVADQYVTTWNGPFDVAWLLAIAVARPDLGIREKVFAVRWLDGMSIRKHLFNTPSFRPRIFYGLKETVAEELPECAGYGDDIDYDDESPEAVAKLLVYNQLDTRYTLWLTRHYLQMMRPETMRCMLIEARSIPLVADAKVNGIKANRQAAADLGVVLDDTRKEKFVRLKMAHPNDISEEVLASSQKLRNLLFKEWGLPPVSLTDTGQYSTDKETLLTLGITDERAHHVFQYREAKNNLTKFAQGTLDSLDYNGDGYVRPDPRIFGTYTGRMTYSSKVGKGVAEQPSGVAIHQWKNDAAFRKIIEPPEGYDLIELDFAGQEFRWMAVESGDPTMLNLCRPGEDAHAYMGARALGTMTYDQLRACLKANPDDPVGKPMRKFGKVGNLSLQYRTYPKTLVKVAAIQHKVKLNLAEAEALRATYLTTYRAVPQYWKRQIALARQVGYIQTLAGRGVHLGSMDTWKYVDGGDATWQHESTAINFPIQGVGADQKYLALLVARNYLPKVDGYFYLELHDGLFFIVPKDKSQRAAQELKALLSNLPYKRAWGVDLPIQFPVDAKRGPSWGELKEE